MDSSNISQFNDPVNETTYDPPRAVFQSYNTPRFGHTNDIVAILGAEEDRNDYVVGLIAAGIVILVVFLVWALVTLVMMCLGQRRVGFWSGAPFVSKISSNTTTHRRHSTTAHDDVGHEDDTFEHAWNGDEEHAHYKHTSTKTTKSTDHSHRKRPFCLRICFLLCGLIFIIFSILLLTKGVAKLTDTIGVFQESLADLDKLANATEAVLGKLDRVGNTSDELYSNLSSQVAGSAFCPGDPGLDFSQQVQTLQNNAQAAVDELGQVNEVLDNSFVEDLDAVIDQYESFANPLNQTLDSIHLDDWRAILPVVVVDVVVGLLMIATVLAMCNLKVCCFGACLNYVLCPLMVLICIVCWVVAAIMITAAGFLGDFCLPGGRGSSPDTTVLAIMNASGYGATDSQFDPYTVAEFYINQCTMGDNPFNFVQDSIPELMAGQKSISTLEGLFNNTNQMNLLAAYCGRDYSPIQELLLQFVRLIDSLLTASLRVLDLISCKTIVPLYVNTVYKGMCTYSPEAVHWVFKAALVMAVMSSIMLSLRASYKKDDTSTVHHHEEEKKDADNDSIHGQFSPARTGTSP